MREKEIWKRYKDSMYEVSSLGRVRNKKTKKIMKQFFRYNGKVENDYLKLNITMNGVRKKKSVHRLVAECFLSDYSEELEVNHKNNLRYDNRLENLEMCTREYNHRYAEMQGRTTTKRPVYAKKDDKMLCFDGLWSAAKYMIELGKTSAKIDHVCNNIKYSLSNENHTAYGFHWYDA